MSHKFIIRVTLVHLHATHNNLNDNKPVRCGDRSLKLSLPYRSFSFFIFNFASTAKDKKIKQHKVSTQVTSDIKCIHSPGDLP